MSNLENIYDIRRNECLMYILPTDSILNAEQKPISEKIVMAINLYYFDTVDFYLSYIDNMPNEIYVYVISSVPEIWDKIEEYKISRKNVFLLKKENRGRDISALLVAFREIALKYEYICFLHDKKAHHAYLEEEVNHWIINLWGNTVGSYAYIQNVLSVFRNNEELGVLAPPEPMGENIESWYGDVWAEDFNNTVKLAVELNLNCNLCKNKQPITIGTVFWARTCALKKLLEREWKYTDFPKEPLPDDGTISHAIERIFAYVAQDAGYKTGTIMSDSYAAWSLLFAQDGMRRMSRLLKEELGVHELYQMDEEFIEEYEKRMKAFFSKNKEVYIYGAGVFGKEMLIRAKRMRLIPTGFVVSDGRRNCKYVNEVPVYELHEVIDRDGVGIIVSLNYGLQEKICKDLQEKGFDNFIRGNILEK